MCWHVYTQALLKTTGADNDCSLGGAFDRVKGFQVNQCITEND